MKKEDIEELVEIGMNAAIEHGYITEHSSATEIEDNFYEIMEFAGENVDEMTDSDYEYALRYAKQF